MELALGIATLIALAIIIPTAAIVLGMIALAIKEHIIVSRQRRGR